MANRSRGVVSIIEHDLILKTVNVAIRECDSKRFAEVGIKKARTSKSIVEQLLTQNKPGYHMLCVDSSSSSGAWWKRLVRPILNENVQSAFHMGLSWESASTVPDNSLAWCFIDADHDYEPCLKDARAWYPKISPGGFLVFHDTGVRSNMLGWYRNGRFGHFGVLRAILESYPQMFKDGFVGYDEIPSGFKAKKGTTGLMVFRKNKVKANA